MLAIGASLVQATRLTSLATGIRAVSFPDKAGTVAFLDDFTGDRLALVVGARRRPLQGSGFTDSSDIVQATALDGSTLGRLYAYRADFGNDNNPSEAYNGNYYHALRVRDTQAGDVNFFPKIMGLNVLMSLSGITTNSPGTQDVAGVWSETGIPDTANSHFFYQVLGSWSSAYAKGAGSSFQMIGAMGKARPQDTHTTDRATGLYGWAEVVGSGAITSAHGTRGVMTAASGSNVTNAYALHATMILSAGSTVANAHGLHVTAAAVAGTVTGARYGVLVDDHTTTSGAGTIAAAYGLYVKGATQNNRVEGLLQVKTLKFDDGSTMTTAPSGGGSTTLAALTDVALSGLADNNFFTYNASTSKWVNRDAAASRTALGLGTMALESASAYAALASPALTGTPTAPTAANATSNTQIATTAFVHALITDLIGAAPSALDTLVEIANQLASDESAVSSLTTTVAGKASKASNLSDLADASAAFGNVAPTTTLGDLIYRGASANVRLAGNSTAAKQFLSQTGTGSVSAAPAWSALAASDIPTTLNATVFASVTVSAAAGAGYAEFGVQSSTPGAPTGGFRAFADSTGRFSWRRASDGFVRTFDAALTANRVFTLQDADGTLAFTSQIPAYAYVTGSDFTTTSTTLVDITGLSIPLAANSRYEVVVWLSCATSADINGIQFALNYTVAGGAVEAWVTPGVFTSNSAFRTDRISALNTATGNRYLQTSGQDGFIVITGTVTTGANAGDLRARCQKATSGTATVRVLSYMRATKTA